MTERRPKIRLNFNLDTRGLVEVLTRAFVAADILGRVRVLEEAAKKIPIATRGPLAAKAFSDSPQSHKGTEKNSPECPERKNFASWCLGGEFSEVLGSFDVKPENAINYVRALTSYTQAAYKRLSGQYRLAAFTVARVENLMLVEKMQGLVGDALDQGWSQAEFEKRANAAFDQAGVTRLNPYHLETVFQTNMQTAYQNGRFQQLRDPEVMRVLSFWQYRTQQDERVRPNHAALDLFVARANDPVWGTIYPPNGFNCRCTVEPMMRSEAEAILGGQINVPGRDRLPPDGGPDEGFDKSPAGALGTLASGEPL